MMSNGHDVGDYALAELGSDYFPETGVQRAAGFLVGEGRSFWLLSAMCNRSF